MQTKTKRLTTLALLTSAALLLSFVETLIPPIVPIPGVKLGLANTVALFTLYRLGWREAGAVSLLRVSLSALLFGSVSSLMYAAAGAVLSLAVMLLAKRLHLAKGTVSILGAVSHNVAQIGVSLLILQTEVVFYYLPALLISGIITGAIIGVIASVLLRKMENIRL